MPDRQTMEIMAPLTFATDLATQQISQFHSGIKCFSLAAKQSTVPFLQQSGLERHDAWNACSRSWTGHYRRKQQRLTTLSKTVEGHIPAMPPENFPMPADRNRRRIHPTTFKGCDSDNTVARHEICNTCGFKIPDGKAEQYKSSFFVRTVADRNQLEDTVVTADCHCIFIRSKQSATRGCLPHTDSQSKNAFSQFLTPSLSQPVKFLDWKELTYMPPSSISDGPVTYMLSILSILIELFSRARKKGAETL